MKLGLSADEVLTTTRAVRKRLDFDRDVDLGLVRECLEVAMQAPTGSNEQGWHFVVVRDSELRSEIARLYQKAWQSYRSSPGFSAFKAHSDDPKMRDVQERMVASVDFLASNLRRVPVFVIPCVVGRTEDAPPPYSVVTQASLYGSILPATWSFMLAARERGLGTSWTTLHLFYEKEIAELLGIPFEELTQVALIPLAHSRGTTFRKGPRKPLDDVLHIDRW